MPTTFPSVSIAQSSSKEVIADVVEVVLGNGYTHRTANGKNYLRDHINIVWSNLDSTKYSTVNSFLDSLESGDYFTWTSPFDTTSKKYILEGSRTITNLGGSIWQITQRVKQVPQ